MDEQDDAFSRMEGCLNDIGIWMRNNTLKLNEDKTDLLIIATARQAHQITINSIRIGDCGAIASKSANNLGATIDSTLSMNDHIKSVVNSCNFQLRSIAQASRFLTNDATHYNFFLP